jgi:hypothetical protein
MGKSYDGITPEQSKGEDGLATYRRDKNARSLDGLAGLQQ